MKKINEYQLIIWDLDGTLYYQKPFRKKMVQMLLGGLLLKPSHWKEIMVILRYRRLREKWDAADTEAGLEKRQYEACGKQCGLSGERVREIIEHWMHAEPLKYLKVYRDEEAAGIIAALRKQGIQNVVYSDYPTKDKLKALEISVDRQFCSADRKISCMKPNPRGILHILEVMGVGPEAALMVGDRMEKDGEAAREAGIDCLILKSGRSDRALQYQKIR
ncbi:MAG: HAD family hydrolase [Lachnospiraceae bacterium]|nr:HAD family hydrolase [Lachnospiraceae bacterium]